MFIIARNFGILFLAASFTVVFHRAFARDLPFSPGEVLEYSMKWGFFPVGSATLEVLPAKMEGNESCYILSFAVRTNAFADKIYKVRTEIESVVNSDFTHALKYRKKQREGRTIRDVEVHFDYQNAKAIYREKGKDSIETPLPVKVFDPLSITYFFRLGKLKSGMSARIPTSDGKKLMDLVVRVGNREKMKVPAGTFYAYGTMPEMKNLSGVFKKSPDGILKVWYSDDSKRLPIKISSKVVIGSFTAKLEKISKRK